MYVQIWHKFAFLLFQQRFTNDVINASVSTDDVYKL